MIKVYTHPSRVDVYEEWIGSDSNFARCNNVDEVLSESFKIACVELRTGIPIGFNYRAFDLLLFSDIEFNTPAYVKQWLAENGITNYLVALGGIEGHSVTGDFIYRPWWTFNLVSLNQDCYTDIDSKPYTFDMLLGAKKPHRDWVFAKSYSAGIVDQSICTYRDVFWAPTQSDIDLERDTGSIATPYPYVSENLVSGMEVVDTVTNQVSSIVPWKIYEQTKYSVLAETHYRGNIFFFSEKPAKIIMARRLFVVFSGYNYLKSMRDELGFKTFGNVIDESYDSEPDTVARFNLAFKQMQRLANMDYREVQAQTQHIREHNFRRLYSLKAEISARMSAMLYKKL